MQETWVQSLGGKIPWRRERLPTPIFWPGEFHGLYSPWGRKESDTTERPSLHLHLYLGYRASLGLKQTGCHRTTAQGKQICLKMTSMSLRSLQMRHPTDNKDGRQTPWSLPHPLPTTPSAPPPPAWAFLRSQSASLWPKQHIIQIAGL